MSIVRKNELSFWFTKSWIVRTHFIGLFIDGPLFVNEFANKSLRKRIDQIIKKLFVHFLYLHLLGL